MNYDERILLELHGKINELDQHAYNHIIAIIIMINLTDDASLNCVKVIVVFPCQ